jgi:hypothetical protein
MRKPHGILLGVVGGVLALISCAAAALLFAHRMPDPDQADLRGLLRWLVTRDLNHESFDLQDRLLARLEVQLGDGLESGEVQKQLSDEQRSQLIDNVEVLGRRWFFNQVDNYFAQPTELRGYYLEQQIRTNEVSGLIKSLKSLAESEGGTVAGSVWATLAERINRWTAAMQPEQKARADEFVAAVQANLLLRTVRSSFLFKS